MTDRGRATPAAEGTRRQRVFFGADPEAVRKYLDDAVANAINETAASIRAVRHYCDQLDKAVAGCRERGDVPCTPCIEWARIARDIRALLPPVPEAVGEVS